MVKDMQQIPEWISRFHRFFDLYCGKLNRSYGLSDKDIGVYIFLWTQKLYSEESSFTRYQIQTRLNLIKDNYFDDVESSFNPRSVKESTEKLEKLGFVTSVSSKGNKNGGNPGIHLYLAQKITDLEQFTREKIERKTNEMLAILQEFYQVEESINEIRGESKKDDSVK